MIVDVIGIEYDDSQTFRKGAAKFPHLFWSLVDEVETFVNGVELSDSVFFNKISNFVPEHVGDIKRKMEEVKNFPLILGGDHSITYYTFSGLKEKFNIEKVIILDAHPDCEESYGHDGVTRRIIEKIGPENVYLYGIRTMSKNENEYIQKRGVKIIKDISELSQIEGNIYLSVDFDVFDPSILPSVGNPELGGINIKEYEEIVRAFSDKIVALDFVEFTPLGGEFDKIYGSLAISIIFKTIAEIIKGGKS